MLLATAASADHYQLLDVRQLGEYREKHLPGAILIPLKELPDRMSELDPQKKTIVYCRSGARSRAAAQLLQQNNFPHVFNMTGGILDWQGIAAQGGVDSGLEFFIEGSYENGVSMAFAMENGLKHFYLRAADIASSQDNQELAELLKDMAKFEDGHMAKLIARYSTVKIAEPEQGHRILEGGIDTEQMLRSFGSHMKNQEDVLQLAMMFEAQAFDLYARLARLADTDEMKSFYLQMADAERKHLDKLAGRLDNLLA